jgi:hypothetical protein
VSTEQAVRIGRSATAVGATTPPSTADSPRRAADHGAVRGGAGAGVTPGGGTPDGGGIAGGPSDGGTPDAGTPSTASTPAQRQDCLEQADQWRYECETRGDMVCKVVKYVAFGSGNFPVGVGLDVFCPSAYRDTRPAARRRRGP